MCPIMSSYSPPFQTGAIPVVFVGRLAPGLISLSPEDSFCRMGVFAGFLFVLFVFWPVRGGPPIYIYIPWASKTYIFRGFYGKSPGF